MVGMAAFLVVSIFARRMLMLEEEVAAGVLTVGASLAAVALVGTAVMSLAALRKHRAIVSALLSGDTDAEPHSLGELDSLPTALTLRFFLTSSVVLALILVPGVRPNMLDDGRAVSLFILGTTILGGASIPHYVLIRRAALTVIELAPLEPLTVLLDVLEMHRIPFKRVVIRLLFAVVAPVALMGVGAVLITHTQLRTLAEQSGRATALLIAKAALDKAPGAPDRGQLDAAASASDFGFYVRVSPQAAPLPRPSLSREPSGQLVVVAPLSEGQAIVRFSASLDPVTLSGSVAVALAGVLVAAILGAMFGRTLADDLRQATRRVRLLGTESVLRGSPQIARPARFAVVADLGRAIEELAQRFRVFAAAQERALEARAFAQQMRSLLFASVSHDLKSPLNAILGFAELVSRERLTLAQRESLELIRNRGRELLALIETILDAARVEAGQLHLLPRLTNVDRLVADVVFKARELAGDPEAEVVLKVAENLPPIPADPLHAPRALGVIVAHAIRTSATDRGAPPARVRVTLPARPGSRLCFDVEFGSRDVTRDELELLFARQATGRGRGLTLGLSLARSTVELHGGAVEVEGAPDGPAICRVWLPLVPPSNRPRLSAFPTLG
jgi:signal transduction histidine kinase